MTCSVVLCKHMRPLILAAALHYHVDAQQNYALCAGVSASHIHWGKRLVKSLTSMP